MKELEALARISEAVSESLYLEESLEAIVGTTMDSLDATGAALVLEDGRVAWPRVARRARRAPAVALARPQIGELVVDRDTPFSDDDRQLLDAIANQAAVALEHGRMALRGVLAQEIHHRVKNNLQTVASLLRLQARAEGVDPAKALGDSVNRILAIAAVHEVLTEHREDVVELAELVDRLRAMLVQGLVAEKEVTPSSHRSSSPASGRPRSRSSSASSSGMRWSTGRPRLDFASERRERRRPRNRRRRRGHAGCVGRHRPRHRACARARRARRDARAPADDGLRAEVRFPA